jgi:6,7-dimethyl-8-ribityllumazine synthase
MKTASSSPKLNGKDLRIAIILARYNDSIGMELYENALATLLKHQVQPENIKLIRVPGALELPLAAKLAAKTRKYGAIIALGVVIKGETSHYELVCENSHRGLMDAGLETGTPVIFGVITALNEQQARERADKDKLSKGREYAQSALEMAQIVNTIK